MQIPTSATWRAARAPGTLAAALIASGATYDELPPIDRLDCWYRASFTNEAPAEIIFHGLATLAEVFIDGVRVCALENMFVASRVSGVRPGRHDLHIRFRSVEREIAAKSGRARWRPRMIAPAGLRHIRTTAFGRMPGFAPPAPPLGPWRAVELIEPGALRVDGVTARSVVSGDGAKITVALTTTASDKQATLMCAGRAAPLQRIDATTLVATLALPSVERWFPHTHGAPHLYELAAEIGGVSLSLGRTGFRSVSLSRGAAGDDFAISINDTPVFCRGAVWTGADALTLEGGRDACAPLLAAMCEAGMNMVRVPGVAFYESDEFFDLCDELGVMVWQDFAFANFDYPIADESFRDSVVQEARQFLARVETSPALVAVCGGSEVYQQAAMLGLAPDKWRSPLFDELLPQIVAQARPDILYVENSPSGGAAPFHVDHGVAHYYGVGAYRRPLTDARRANVRFATECLGFSCAPESATLSRDFGEAAPTSPLWESRIPRDMGAQQNFRDVTEHYMRALYGCAPERLRVEEPARYLDIMRACVAEVMAETIGEWRRAQSATRGALVWFLKDLWPGAGWGVIDADGEPKSAYYALKRAFAPVQIFLIDEGVNGLHLHLVNDSDSPIQGEATLTCYRDGGTVVMRAVRAVAAAPRSVAVFRDIAFWGAFFDTSLAYGFGPPSHDATVATLSVANHGPALSAFHFPQGRQSTRSALGLRADVVSEGSDFYLRLTTGRVAQSVCIEDENFRPDDNWFHLAPGAEKWVRLRKKREALPVPKGAVRALNGESVAYDGRAAGQAQAFPQRLDQEDGRSRQNPT